MRGQSKRAVLGSAQERGISRKLVTFVGEQRKRTGLARQRSTRPKTGTASTNKPVRVTYVTSGFDMNNYTFQCSGSGIPNIAIFLGGAAQQIHTTGGAKEYKQPKRLGVDPSCRYDLAGWDCVDVGAGGGVYRDSDCADDACGCDYGLINGHCVAMAGGGAYLDEKCTNKDCNPVGRNPQQRAAARSKFIVNQLERAASDPNAINRAHAVAKRLQEDIKVLQNNTS